MGRLVKSTIYARHPWNKTDEIPVTLCQTTAKSRELLLEIDTDSMCYLNEEHIDDLIHMLQEFKGQIANQTPTCQ